MGIFVVMNDWRLHLRPDLRIAKTHSQLRVDAFGTPSDRTVGVVLKQYLALSRRSPKCNVCFSLFLEELRCTCIFWLESSSRWIFGCWNLDDLRTTDKSYFIRVFVICLAHLETLWHISKIVLNPQGTLTWTVSQVSIAQQIEKDNYDMPGVGLLPDGGRSGD